MTQTSTAACPATSTGEPGLWGRACTVPSWRDLLLRLQLWHRALADHHSGDSRARPQPIPHVRSASSALGTEAAWHRTRPHRAGCLQGAGRVQQGDAVPVRCSLFSELTCGRWNWTDWPAQVPLVHRGQPGGQAHRPGSHSLPAVSLCVRAGLGDACRPATEEHASGKAGALSCFRLREAAGLWPAACAMSAGQRPASVVMSRWCQSAACCCTRTGIQYEQWATSFLLTATQPPGAVCLNACTASSAAPGLSRIMSVCSAAASAVEFDAQQAQPHLDFPD